MNFYNPYQKKPANQIQGRNFQAGAYKDQGMFAPGVTYDMIGTGQWGTGESLQGASRQAILSNLRDARSTANPDDYAAMGELRDYYRGQLQDLPTSGNSSFHRQAQGGLKNVSAAMGGVSGYGGARGPAQSRMGSEYVNGLINARAAAGPQAKMINAGLGNIQAQDMKERSLQLFQAQSMAEAINRLVALDQNRQDEIAASAAQKHADRMGLISSFVSPFAEYAGGYAAQKMSQNKKQPTTRYQSEYDPDYNGENYPDYSDDYNGENYE